MSERRFSAKQYIHNYLRGFGIQKLIETHEDLSDRQKDILIRFFLKMEHPIHIGETHGLTAERVRQIAVKAQQRVYSRITRANEIIEKLNDSLAQNRLKDWQIKKLKEDIQRNEIVSKIKDDDFSGVNGISIEDVDLSARAYNVLKSSKINYIGDILNYTPEDLMAFRNFGKKSVQAIQETLFENYGISWHR